MSEGLSRRVDLVAWSVSPAERARSRFSESSAFAVNWKSGLSSTISILVLVRGSACGMLHDHERPLIEVEKQLLKPGGVRVRQCLKLQAKRLPPHPPDDGRSDFQRPMGIRQLDFQSDHALSWEGYL